MLKLRFRNLVQCPVRVSAVPGTMTNIFNVGGARVGVQVIPPATGVLQPADGAFATCMRDRTHIRS